MESQNQTSTLISQVPPEEEIQGVLRSRVKSPSWWLKRVPQKASAAIFLLLIAYSAICSVYRAEMRHFWNDEVATWIVAEQPNFASMMAALRAGADGQPPAFYLVERAFAHWIPNQEIAFRVPSIFGYCLTVFCLFLWVRRRNGVLIAIVAGLIPFITILYDTFAIEARPYALMVGFIAAALVCYQRVPGWQWTTGLGVCLFLAEAFHAYGVLAMLPIAAAEGVLTFKTRWLRKGVWLALLCGASPLAVSWPLLMALKKCCAGPHYWAYAKMGTPLGFFNWLFRLPVIFSRESPATTEGIILTIVFVLGTMAAAVVLVVRGLRARPTDDPHFHEQVLISIFLAMPLVVYAAAKISHGGCTERYMLPALIGISLGTGYALRRRSRKYSIALGGLILVSFCVQEVPFWITRYNLERIHAKPPSVETLVSSAGHEELPVAVSEEIGYLTLDHYAPPSLAKRFVALIDFPAAITYTGNDSIERELLVLKGFAPIRVYPFEEFRKEHPVFLLYSRTGGLYYQDWWPIYLARAGYSVKLLTASGIQSVFLVDLRKTQSEENELGDSRNSSIKEGRRQDYARFL